MPTALPSSALSTHPARARRLLRATALAAAVGALLLAPVASASAHVHVTPAGTAAGSSTELTFRVPAESETASTTALTVHLPTTTPFTTVSVKSMPGWTATVTTSPLPSPVEIGGATITEAASEITWTATAGGIAPEEYATFAATVGPLPKEGTTVLLPTTQTYSDGSVVEWNEKTPARGTEPENPAPSLVTTAGTGASDDGDGDGDDDGDEAAPAVAPAAATTSTSPSDATARALAGGGLVLGAAALVVAFARGRRTGKA